MSRSPLRAASSWLWPIGCMGGWIIVSSVCTPVVNVAILGRQSAFVAAPWDLASLDVVRHLGIALALGAVAAFFVGVLEWFAPAPRSLWSGVVTGAAILLVLSYGRYAPGSWPLTVFAVEQGIPTIGVIAGAYVGSYCVAGWRQRSHDGV